MLFSTLASTTMGYVDGDDDEDERTTTTKKKRTQRPALLKGRLVTTWLYTAVEMIKKLKFYAGALTSVAPGHASTHVRT